MFNTPKVLVAGPISSVKDYCFDEWVDNVKNLDVLNKVKINKIIFDNIRKRKKKLNDK